MLVLYHAHQHTIMRFKVSTKRIDISNESKIINKKQ